jgi:hypothetical protein
MDHRNPEDHLLNDSMIKIRKTYYVTDKTINRFPHEWICTLTPKHLICQHCRCVFENQCGMQYLVYDVQVHADWVERDAYLDGFVCFANTQLTKYKKWEITRPKQTFRVWFSDMQGRKLRVKADVIQKFVGITFGSNVMPISHEDIVNGTIQLSILKGKGLTGGTVKYYEGENEISKSFTTLTKIEDGKATVGSKELPLADIIVEFTYKGETVVLAMIDLTTVKIPACHLKSEWIDRDRTPNGNQDVVRAPACCTDTMCDASHEVFVSSFVLELLLMF